MNQQAVPRTNSSAAIAGIVAVSLVALGFLCWLLFVHQAVPTASGRFDFLLPLEGVFNGASAVALIVGLRMIKRRRITAHRNAMLSAFVFSSLFLICYIVHHALHGDQLFAGHGAIRAIYLGILISHIVLSAVALPLILVTFFFALTGRFGAHRKLAPVTYPIWLYVSVTGVVVYAMLSAWR
ncbi:MAG TPA: DUF420 domain-containing protein [Acidobacterium sp.]|uniref:Putative membrane protein n=1 Tax=Acidobacterium capsulatum (strain ATCC 51196 / DSM 11244 / BCRC 80197 / JCM 7670 / NBRC 15755 / NCIMB 13165 / 161) TaxID=240015 RepID=C1F3G6_ACIC5|nr:putative membrane protein [Acidobacterium capsulatum ATCC 51196]HCT60192.1 DUF420 domain-containing protein [Acidobacterium sp.]